MPEPINEHLIFRMSVSLPRFHGGQIQGGEGRHGYAAEVMVDAEICSVEEVAADAVSTVPFKLVYTGFGMKVAGEAQ